jgi:ATP-dependent helicase HrpB
LQVFGLMATPRVASGRVPLVMELLSPRSTPLQRTSDLANFWATSYTEV